MPTLVNGEMTFTFEEAIAPAILKMYGGEIKVVVTDDLATLTFPNMHSAASWASTMGLTAQTWLTGPTYSFGDHVQVDVMHPDA